MVPNGLKAASGIVFGSLVGGAFLLFGIAAACALIDLEWLGADLLIAALVCVALALAIGVDHGK